MSWLIKKFLGLSALPASELNQLRENLSLLKLHTHTGAIGDGADAALWRGAQDYIQYIAPSNNSSHSAGPGFVDTLAEFGFYILRGGAIASTNPISWSMSLRPGTWRLDLLHFTSIDLGIATVTLGATTLGTIDFYSASTVRNVVSSITGFTVSNTDRTTIQTLTLQTNSKNASSSSYLMKLQFLALRRTGA